MNFKAEDLPIIPQALVTCPECKTRVLDKGNGRLAVHFAKNEDIKPCVKSWPDKKPPAAPLPEAS
jgi:hypothetical protein